MSEEPRPVSTSKHKWQRDKRQRIRDHTPTDGLRDQVRALAYLRTEPRIIADLLGVHFQVLQYHYMKEITDGPKIVAAKLGMLIIQNALKGDKGALGQIARAQQIGRQDEGDKRDVTPNDSPLDIAGLTEAELEGLLGALAGGKEEGSRRGH
jgi:hypothetical protein